MRQHDPELLDVLECSLKHGLLPPGSHNGPALLSLRLFQKRIDFLLEEMDELAKAAENGDLAEVADALVDIVYVAKGTALMLGIPWEAHWAEVQRANMAKKVGYVEKRGNKRDLVKPPGWVPPQHEAVLAEAGYTSMDTVDLRGRDWEDER